MDQPTHKLPDILANHISDIHDICRRYHVKSLWAIGSVLTENFRPDSDLDFLYELDQASIPAGHYLKCLDGLIAGLLALFSGREIDLIHYPDLRNPYFIQSIEDTKTLLYVQRPAEVSV